MGESYAGHYVPHTVAAIERGNARLPAGSPELIALAGFTIGNAYTDYRLDFGVLASGDTPETLLRDTYRGEAGAKDLSSAPPCVVRRAAPVRALARAR